MVNLNTCLKDYIYCNKTQDEVERKKGETVGSVRIGKSSVETVMKRDGQDIRSQIMEFLFNAAQKEEHGERWVWGGWCLSWPQLNLMLGCDHSSMLMAEGFVMLANAVLMFKSTSIPHHPSFMKKESGGGGEVVKQHRGAIKLPVMCRSALLLLRPHFATTHFHMREDKSPG